MGVGVALQCVVPENIHTPPRGSFETPRGRGGSKAVIFEGVHGTLLFQRVTNHVKNIKRNL